MSKKIAVFPGSFDPVTIGHMDLIQRASLLFDELIVAVGYNIEKKGAFDLEQRVKWLEESCKPFGNVSVDTYQGLTIDYCTSKNAQFILRGIRNSADLEFEKSIAQMNQAMNPTIDSYFLMARLEHSAISSSIVRDIIRNKGDFSPFVPASVQL
ncbi:MAG: pantetheine-phosphate adenylyltransferase [Candidatus Azotimanducaceae bacterium]|jgi:pantetheine-phosphate adenylyltransferase